MRDTATMVNGFDMSSVDALDPELRTIVERRASLLGPAYKLFYRNPVRIVRGEGVHLYDADGQVYLDAYNNVPSVGHCHPHVVEAIARQAATLNTHTRYASELILDYAERLLGTYPAGIGNVMFTCTGSEAVDLALRIARFYTGGDGVVITANAYHGVTAAAAEISPSLGPAVPLGRTVWTVAAPGPGDTHESLAERVRTAIADMNRHGVRLAAFIADTLFSSDGIRPEPAGFLRPVADAVRAAGGVFIADEVQPGFGRTGEAMWGFQRHGVEPDLAVMGKPMGNGMPIAGVAARPEILPGVRQQDQVLQHVRRQLGLRRRRGRGPRRDRDRRPARERPGRRRLPARRPRRDRQGRAPDRRGPHVRPVRRRRLRPTRTTRPRRRRPTRPPCASSTACASAAS